MAISYQMRVLQNAMLKSINCTCEGRETSEQAWILRDVGRARIRSFGAVRDYTRGDFSSNLGRIRDTSTGIETDRINPQKRKFLVNNGDFQNRKKINSDGSLYF